MSSSRNVSSNTLTGPGLEGSSSQTNTGRSTVSEQELVEKCLNIVKDYKHRIISKQEAFVTITKAVASATHEATDQAESYIAAPYFDMLDELSRNLDNVRGQREPDVAQQSEERDSVTPREDENQREQSFEQGEPSRKRCRLDLSCLGRAEQSFTGSQLSANLTRTNEILLNWSQDPKEAEIISGKCVNLDAVHSIISSSRTIDKCTETLEDIEIKFSGTMEAVSKKITSATQAARAIKFTFPHREDELATYGDYINDKFDRRLQRTHDRIIRYDKAVRNRAANSRRTSSPNPVHLHRTSLHSVDVSPATNGTRVNVPAALKPVATHMFVHTSKTGGYVHDITQKQGISRSQSPSPLERPSKCLCHRWGLIWSPMDISFSPTARSSEYAEPIPSPPLTEIENSDAARTIAWSQTSFTL
ncbi:hypothetical protein EV702DRAFT_1114272 [Suillus placidus]|uniref:Uncharacterized protein n=1 Tax=Suillus placidus TaxID=48579 RepID=A0A9P7D166_9AGAM|nr:hypothetical protein EV702DRAFT_1114272 [Suillus placidus]